MAAKSELEILIRARDEASSVLNKITGGIGNLAGIAAGVAVAGLAALGAGLAYSINAAGEAEQISAQLNATLKSTGGAAGLTRAALDDMAASLQSLTTYDDDAIAGAEDVLLQFQNIKGVVYKDALPAILDMAAKMGTDLKDAAGTAGKALSDPIAGMGLLKRQHVTFTDAQEKTIKAMVEGGNIAGAQRIIIEQMGKAFGGSAAAAAGTFSGKMQQVQNTLGNMAETIGGAFLPALTTGLGGLNTFLEGSMGTIQGFASSAAEVIGTTLNLIMNPNIKSVATGGPFDAFYASIVTIRDAVIKDGPAIQDALGRLFDIKGGAGALDTVVSGIDSLAGAIDNVAGTIDKIKEVSDAIGGFISTAGGIKNILGTVSGLGSFTSAISGLGLDSMPSMNDSLNQRFVISTDTTGVDPNFVPGSPTPFEMGLRGIQAAIGDVSKTPLKVGGGAMGGSGGPDIYNDPSAYQTWKNSQKGGGGSGMLSVGHGYNVEDAKAESWRKFNQDARRLGEEKEQKRQADMAAQRARYAPHFEGDWMNQLGNRGAAQIGPTQPPADPQANADAIGRAITAALQAMPAPQFTVNVDGEPLARIVSDRQGGSARSLARVGGHAPLR